MPTQPGSGCFISGLVAAAGFLGYYVRNPAGVSRRAATTAAERLERERDQQAQLAAAAERARIAREMHDIVAHNIAVMIALADGAAYTAARRARTRRRPSWARSRPPGRSALTEMRRLLGVMREPAASRARAAADARRPRRPAGDRPRGRPASPADRDRAAVPAAAERQLAIYRMIQEALTNTLKHAAAARRPQVRPRLPAGHGRARGDRRRAHSGRPDRAIGGSRTGRQPAAGTASPACGNGPPSSAARCPPGRGPDGGWRVHTVLRIGPPRSASGRLPTTDDRVTISILLVDDQPMLRLGFRLVLDAQAGHAGRRRGRRRRERGAHGSGHAAPTWC